jgi:hypothetical protein
MAQPPPLIDNKKNKSISRVRASARTVHITSISSASASRGGDEMKITLRNNPESDSDAESDDNKNKTKSVEKTIILTDNKDNIKMNEIEVVNDTQTNNDKLKNVISIEGKILYFNFIFIINLKFHNTNFI